jgi:hypothetical protein
MTTSVGATSAYAELYVVVSSLINPLMEVTNNLAIGFMPQQGQFTSILYNYAYTTPSLLSDTILLLAAYKRYIFYRCLVRRIPISYGPYLSWVQLWRLLRSDFPVPSGPGRMALAFGTDSR